MRIIAAKEPPIKNRNFTYELKYIKISWINTYYYCPYQIYLSEVKGYRVPPTKNMIAGTTAHMNLEKEHEELVEVEMSIEEALKVAKEEKKAFSYREVPVYQKYRRFQVGGKMDMLIIYPDHVEIIEDKTSERAYLSSIMQLWGYALIFRDSHKLDRKIVGVVRNSLTKKEMFREGFEKHHEKEVAEVFEKLYLISRGTLIPSVNPSEKKCENCRFKDVCDAYQELIGKP